MPFEKKSFVSRNIKAKSGKYIDGRKEVKGRE